MIRSINCPVSLDKLFDILILLVRGSHVHQSRVGEILEKLFDENCQGRLIPICSKHSLVGNLYFIFGAIALDSFSVYGRPGLPYIVCLYSTACACWLKVGLVL